MGSEGAAGQNTKKHKKETQATYSKLSTNVSKLSVCRASNSATTNTDKM